MNAPKHKKKRIMELDSQCVLKLIEPGSDLPKDAEVLDVRMDPTREGIIQFKLCSDQWDPILEGAPAMGWTPIEYQPKRDEIVLAWARKILDKQGVKCPEQLIPKIPTDPTRKGNNESP